MDHSVLLKARHTNPGNIYLICIYKRCLSYIHSEAGTSPLPLHDLLCSLKLDISFPINITMLPECILKILDTWHSTGWIMFLLGCRLAYLTKS